MFWTRAQAHTVEFIHLHRSGSSYGKPINYSVDFTIELGLRVLNDPFPAMALNGPSSNAHGLPETWGFHLRFNAKTGSTYEKCIQELSRFVQEQAEPWLARFRTETVLLAAPDSPLDEAQKECLRLALAGLQDAQVVAQSRQKLGVKVPRNR